MEFLSIFGRVVAKNRAFVNNIIFLQQFFNFGGGGRSLCSPGGAYGSGCGCGLRLRADYEFDLSHEKELPR